MNQYNTLNDAGERIPSLLPGATEIWYQKRFGTLPSEIDFRDLTKTHVKLGSVASDDCEEIYVYMQGENWSPEGEARTLISSLGLRHTSMSIGDIVVIGDKIGIVFPLSFRVYNRDGVQTGTVR